MFRRLVLGLGSLAIALAAWTACTGDDPVVGATGALGEPCSAGGACNTPELQCSAGYCRLRSAGGDGGGSSAGSSSSSSGGSSSSSGGGSSSSGSVIDAGHPCIDLRPPAASSTLNCTSGDMISQPCVVGTACCPGQGCVKAGNSCDHGAPPWSCLANEQCDAGSGCYLAAGLWWPDGGACGVPDWGSAPDSMLGARCMGTPPWPWLQLCSDAGRCDNEKPCKPTAVKVNGVMAVVGLCHD